MVSADVTPFVYKEKCKKMQEKFRQRHKVSQKKERKNGYHRERPLALGSVSGPAHASTPGCTALMNLRAAVSLFW
jgi:hypothetical protein